jgi:hypothetical protein
MALLDFMRGIRASGRSSPSRRFPRLPQYPVELFRGVSRARVFPARVLSGSITGQARAPIPPFPFSRSTGKAGLGSAAWILALPGSPCLNTPMVALTPRITVEVRSWRVRFQRTLPRYPVELLSGKPGAVPGNFSRQADCPAAAPVPFHRGFRAPASWPNHGGTQIPP